MNENDILIISAAFIACLFCLYMGIRDHGSNDIPVEFEWQGKEYKGFLSRVSGGASGQGETFQLYIKRRYYGILHLAEDSPPGLLRDIKDAKYKWRWSPQTRGQFESEEILNYFVDVLTEWYGSK
jgi:hypothetical protein